MSPSRRLVLSGFGLAALAIASTGCSRPEQIRSGSVQISASEVPVGSGLIVSDSQWVVTQPTAGSYRAFDRTCPHAGCPVSSVVSDQIVCGCHNSRFAVADGAVVQGPAQEGLTEAPVNESGGTLTIG